MSSYTLTQRRPSRDIEVVAPESPPRSVCGERESTVAAHPANRRQQEATHRKRYPSTSSTSDSNPPKKSSHEEETTIVNSRAQADDMGTAVDDDSLAYTVTDDERVARKIDWVSTYHVFLPAARVPLRLTAAFLSGTDAVTHECILPSIR